uniref:EGF-like domain-containing protein n=2 Tax=Clytia hemisphaerica TaxID=252671 RepID=A0A7M6DR33_9CNID
MNIRHVDLSKNAFKKYPTNLGLIFPHLQHLDLTANKIMNISKEDFTNSRSLKTLILNKNLIEVLPTDTFVYLTTAEKIYLTENRIKNISPFAFRGLSQTVDTIMLNRNKLTNLPTGVFKFIHNPTSRIFLHQNQIQNLPDNLFGDVTTINRLDLYNNNLQQINTKTFEHIHVDVLNFEYNNITLLPVTDLKTKFLLLASNPIECSCKLSTVLIRYKSSNKLVFGDCYDEIRKNGSVSKITKQFKKLIKQSDVEITEALCEPCEKEDTCLNGGFCIVQNETNVICQCSNGFHGNRCQDYVTEKKGVLLSHSVLVVIIVTIVVVVLALVIIGFFVWRKRRHREKSPQVEVPATETAEEGRGGDRVDRKPANEETKLL